MGASDWNYIVPYQANIGQALQALRQLVFEQGAYYKRAEFLARILEFQPDDLQDRLQDEINRQQTLPPPTSIAGLLERNGEEGTHSIIDIEAVSMERGFRIASPLAEQELIDLFGTQPPSREMVADKEQARILATFRRRWEALYIVVYKDGQPTEIFFRGFSGD